MIYTKTGDQGETGVIGGKRLSKADSLFEVIGNLDELNSLLGLVRSLLTDLQVLELGIVDKNLKLVQGELFELNAKLAGANPKINLTKRTSWLEKQIDSLSTELNLLNEFIYPAGHPIAAQLLVARTVCRRTERSLVGFGQKSPARRGQKSYLEINAYLNRLGDYLFILARWVNLKMGFEEERWKRSPLSKPN